MDEKSEVEAMQELAKQLYERYIKPRASTELLNHSLDGYKAEVVSNNGDGTLTVKRPFDCCNLTLKCPPALSESANPGDQVLVTSLGDMSNSFILCDATLKGFGNAAIRPTAYDFSAVDSANYFLETVSGGGVTITTRYNVSRDEQGRIIRITDASDGWETAVSW